jgi:hypothetical protein
MQYGVFVWTFLNSGSAKKSGVLTRILINFGSSAENWALLQKPVKKSGQKLVILSANENYSKIIMKYIVTVTVTVQKYVYP